MKRTRHLLKSSVLVMLFFGVGKLTGLIRTRLISTAFGVGSVMDAFTAANQLPEVFFTVIAGGSLAAAFIPIYSDYLTREDKKATARLTNSVITLVILILGVISALGALFAPWLVRVVLVPDFSPENQMLTAQIMRVILIQTTIFGVSGVLSSILNAHQHFALPALAPIALDVGYLVGILLFVPRMGIIGLAWGTVVGGVLHIVIQLPALVRYRISYRPALDWHLAGLGEIVRLMGPRIVTLGTIQLADLFIIRLASGLPAGSTSGYFYGYALMQLPQTLFGTAVALVIFPTLAELYNGRDMKGLRETAVSTLSTVWTLTIPAAVGMVILGRPVITLLLQGGAFDAAATNLVYTVLVVFSVRIVSESTLEIVARLFYAQHNTRTPMFTYIGWLLVNVVLAYFLVPTWGIVALALSSTIAFTLLAALLLWLNHRALGGLNGRSLAISGGRAVLAAAGMGLVVWGSGRFIQSPFLFLLVGGLSGLLSYLIFNLMLGGKELSNLLKLLKQSDTR